MCDIVPGQIIFGGPVEGPGAEVANEVLRRFDARGFRQPAIQPVQEPSVFVPGPQTLHFALHEGTHYTLERRAVMAGREREAADAIRELAFEESVRIAAGDPWAAEQLARPTQRVIAQPVHYVHPLDSVATAAPFRLSATHWRYLQALGVKPGSQRSMVSPTVAVLDGGFASSQFQGSHASADQVAPLEDLVGSPCIAASAAVTHGTLIASIVASASPASRVLPIRVYGETRMNGGKAATEWSLMHGLRVALERNADVINISMGFGLQGHECPECGTLSQASRSAALELVIRDAVGSTVKGPVVVGAGGNKGYGIFDFPARFDNSVAISSVNSRGEPSSFTNFDHMVMHPWHLAAPGGDGPVAQEIEWVAESIDRRYTGTSFAAAYATALIAQTIADKGQGPTGALSMLAAAADSSIPSYDPCFHGKGIIHSV